MIQVQIFPHRLIGANRTEKILNELLKVESIRRIVVQGPKLYKDDPERRMIQIEDKKFILEVMVGRILLELYDAEEIDTIKEICDEHLPCGFEVHLGKFMRTQKTVTDHLKYGGGLEKVPDKLVGLVDPDKRLVDYAVVFGVQLQAGG